MPETHANQPVMYGIPNCGTIKKARNWFAERNLPYQFHDYKKQGIDAAQLQGWLDRLGWEQLINKRGTTWRNLEENSKNNMNASAALRVMLENSSIIKRPIIEFNGELVVGYDEAVYQQVFNA